MANIVIFCILAVVILGSAVLSVMTTRIMRAATFLLFVLFGIAGIYILLDYTFLGAAQISIYAGGITMMYIFAINLVSKNTLQGLVERFKGTRVFQGALISLVGLGTVVVVFLKSQFITRFTTVEDVEVPMSQIGTALVGSDKYQYVLPFELISVFLLACIIGGIMIARKEDKK
ncbi:NADH-quinone oxidoreductase subunit J [Prevotella sp. KH2C16]|uniref:NADH-quinone oxidoreductase subunit J family protein n=1 Tax=Prevotella sp. KH2C16 TaxID=1855325 RepID=UPI0008ED41DC|nr:NADH-quinone oxidoreductase subunit J [Prevotella sp. KH2C16]SFF91850.1 NADH-quinone oxidoreductase subunit J [Prevotella sp. KH2C16]